MSLVHLRKVEVQGFRAFGSLRQSFELPRTVAVVWGGNSQGKSSLAEALEFLFTGNIARRELLASTKDEFCDSLRNVHLPPNGVVEVAAHVVCSDGVERILKRVLIEDYGRSNAGCATSVEIDGHACQEADLSARLGLKLLQPPLRAPILAQHTLGYLFSASPNERASYFRAVLDTQDLDDFRSLVFGISGRLVTRSTEFQNHLAAIEALNRLAPSVGRLHSAADQEALAVLLSASIGELLQSTGCEAKGALAERAELLANELAAQRAKTFPLTMFARKQFSPWGGLPQSARDVVSKFESERDIVDSETRRLSELFAAALAIPAVAEATDSIDCPVCLSPEALTQARVQVIRGELQKSAAYAAAEKDLFELLQSISAGMTALIHSVGEATPKFLASTRKERHDAGFRVPVIKQLVDADAAVTTWVKAVGQLQKGARELTKAAKRADALARSYLEAIDLWEGPAKLSAALKAVQTAQANLTARSDSYVAHARAIFEPLKSAVDRAAATDGWDSLIEGANQPHELWQSIKASQERTFVERELDRAVREIDAAIGKVSDEKFEGLSNAVRGWWELLRPDEPTFFHGVQRRSSKARRTIDLRVGLSASPDRTDPKGRDAIAVLSQSQLHCLGLSLFLARAVREEVGFVILDDPVLSSDDDFRPNFASSVVEALLATGTQVVVLTQDHKTWKDIGHRWAHRDVVQLQLMRNDPIQGTEIRDQSDDLAMMLSRAQPYTRSQDPEQRKTGGRLLRESIERFGKEMLVRRRRIDGDNLASITDYDGQNFGNYSANVFALLSKDPSHSGKLRAAHAYVTPAPHDDTPPAASQLKMAYGEVKMLKREYLD